MSPLTTYRRLVTLAGPRYLVLAFLARLPLAMGRLGTLLLVSSATGRYAAGGLAAGALAVGTAVGAPVAGGLADRRGQRTVVAVQSLGAPGSRTPSRDAAPPVANSAPSSWPSWPPAWAPSASSSAAPRQV